MYSGLVIGIIFWLFIAGVSITPIVLHFKGRRAAMDVIRVAIERDKELSPETIKQLSTLGDNRSGKISAVGLQIGGIIVSAIGLGVIVVATIFLFVIPVVSTYVYAGAGLILSIGAGLHVGSKALRQYELNEKSPNP